MERGVTEMAGEAVPPAAPPRALAGAWARFEPSLRPWTWWIVWAVFAVAIAIMAASNQKTGPDFAVFHRAATRLLQGESLYQLSDGHWVYKYAPTVSFFFVPFSPLGLRAGWTVVNLLSALALVRLMRWSAGRLGGRTDLLTHVLILLAVNPYSTNLFRLGQVDAALLWLLIESEERAESRPWLSGLLWATACLFKPPFLVFLPVAIAFRQWRRLGGLIAGGLGWVAAGALPFGIAGNFEQLRAWRATLAATTPGLLCNEQNQSAWAIACTYFAAPESGLAFRAALAAVAAATLGLAAWAVVRSYSRDERRGRAVAAAAALYLSGFLSPLGWRTNLLGAIPLLYLLLSLARPAATPALRRAAVAVVAAGVGGELLDRLLGWFLGQGRVHQLVLESRYFGLAGLLAAVTALTAVALERGHAPSPGG